MPVFLPGRPEEEGARQDKHVFVVVVLRFGPVLKPSVYVGFCYRLEACLCVSRRAFGASTERRSRWYADDSNERKRRQREREAK